MNKHVKLLMIAQHYAPEEVSGAVLATHLAQDLAKLGVEVTFLTAAPSYPKGKVFAGYRNHPFSIEQMGEVKIVRTWSYISPSKSILSRLVNYATFSLAAFIGGLVSGRYDMVFSYSPPLPLGLSAWFISSLQNIPWILRVEDLYPDAAIAAGVLRNQKIIQFFLWLERLLYQKASHVSLISEEFRKNLISKGIRPDHLSVTPVWADPDEIQPGERRNEFRKSLGLQDQFIVLYAGNLGQTASFDEVIGAAEQLQKNPKIHFVFVGEGVRKSELLDQAKEKQLHNVSFLPFQPREKVAEMVAASDLCLVTLNPDSSSYSLPSKTFNYMAGGRPILSVSPVNSEIAQLMIQHDCGINVPNGDRQRIVEVIGELSSDPARTHLMGDNGRKALKTFYSRQVCVDQFFRLINHHVH